MDPELAAKMKCAHHLCYTSKTNKKYSLICSCFSYLASKGVNGKAVEQNFFGFLQKNRILAEKSNVCRKIGFLQKNRIWAENSDLSMKWCFEHVEQFWTENQILNIFFMSKLLFGGFWVKLSNLDKKNSFELFSVDAFSR